VILPVADKTEVLQKAKDSVAGQVIYCPLIGRETGNFWILGRNETGNLVPGYDQDSKQLGVFAETKGGSCTLFNTK